MDIVLLSADKSVFQKILDWEESAKLKHAQALKLFYDKKGSDMTTDHPQVAAFIARSATKIEGLRQQHGRKKNGKGAMEVASE